MENNERKNVFECVICLGVPNDPVATTCGHVYCWLCLKNWLSNKTVLQCPVCKNGIDPNKIISLFSGNSSGQKFFYIKISDPSKPKPERIDPVVNKNREGYVN
jgi:E3 ubiquitin-protein ligase RNF5